MAFLRQTIVSDLITLVRETLQDMDGDRYTDLRIIRALNLGVLEVRRTRPDYFIGTYDEPTWLASDLNETVPLPQNVLPSVIVYATGWIELGDDEYANDGRAAALLKKFSTDLGVP
jgi:hypothetical protein